ncbi:PREDICTED: probable elongation factor 1-delta isoform X1 [Rhagoletis zephyria]|uniref:probable elongation factor 1-delta isoform X1 n=1 Tax=Rhagoletis zephyria TaxID=28612 RepID=UPI0008118A7A|nr:PREDICTED: probable elongation factor 1-delta isoform X1 [Rhagoletis zephyria]
MTTTLAADRFWVDKANFHNAERQYYEFLNKEEDKQISGDGHLNGVQEPPSKQKKNKKIKNKKNESIAKVTEISTNSESEERLLLTGHQVNAPIEIAKVGAKSTGEKLKKRNKTAKKNTDLSGTAANSQCTLVSEIAKAREHIKNSLEKMDGITTLTSSPVSGEVLDRVAAIEKDNADLRKLVESLKSVCLETQNRITALEKKVNTELSGAVSANPIPAPAAKAAPVKVAAEEDDDDVDLFGSEEEEDDEAARIREERLAAYAAKKSKKPQIIAKSSLILDVKPWDDETDLKVMETEIRKIETDGLLWGASKFVPVAFGIQKLSISCVVEDDKVSIDWLTEEIEKLEDYVQSVDVAAFNKI